VPPSFDVAQIAKDSDARLAAAQPANEESSSPRSEMRLATRPTMGAALTDEAWARGMTGAPYVIVSLAQLKRLPLGHRAGFLLSLMDGATELGTVLELAAMPRDEALRMARDLFESGVVAFRRISPG
jgi:hypothetical protein